VAYFDFFGQSQIITSGTFQGLDYSSDIFVHSTQWGTVVYADGSQLYPDTWHEWSWENTLGDWNTTSTVSGFILTFYSDVTCREDIFENQEADYHTQGIEIDQWQIECIDGNCEDDYDYYYCEGDLDDCVQN
jgi:hypothetical protein